MNPFYSEEFATTWGSTQTNIAANLAIIGTMRIEDSEGNVVYEDPRLPKFFDKNKAGQYMGCLLYTSSGSCNMPSSGQ